MSKPCSLCKGTGLYPFCEKCYESIDFTIRHNVKKEKKKAQARNYEDENLEAINRSRVRDNDKYIIRLVTNQLKVHGILSIESATDEQIEEIFGASGELTSLYQQYQEAMDRK